MFASSPGGSAISGLSNSTLTDISIAANKQYLADDNATTKQFDASITKVLSLGSEDTKLVATKLSDSHRKFTESMLSILDLQKNERAEVMDGMRSDAKKTKSDHAKRHDAIMDSAIKEFSIKSRDTGPPLTVSIAPTQLFGNPPTPFENNHVVKSPVGFSPSDGSGLASFPSLPPAVFPVVADDSLDNDDDL